MYKQFSLGSLLLVHNLYGDLCRFIKVTWKTFFNSKSVLVFLRAKQNFNGLTVGATGPYRCCPHTDASIASLLSPSHRMPLGRAGQGTGSECDSVSGSGSECGSDWLSLCLSACLRASSSMSNRRVWPGERERERVQGRLVALGPRAEHVVGLTTTTPTSTTTTTTAPSMECC